MPSRLPKALSASWPAQEAEKHVRSCIALLFGKRDRYLPGHILCVTFTNMAAGEMRTRIHNLTGDNDTGYICTFHSFCVSVLHEDAHVIQYPESFLVLDNSDIDDMLATVYEERGLTLRHMTFSAARDKIEILKLKERPDYYKDLVHLSIAGLKEKYDNAESVTDIIFYGYLYEQKKCFGLDYNDLIVLSLDTEM